MYVFCNDPNLHSVYIRMDGRYFEVRPEDYLDEAGNGVCFLGWQTNTQNYWLLGNSFMRGYYVIFDDEQNRIGLVN